MTLPPCTRLAPKMLQPRAATATKSRSASAPACRRRCRAGVGSPAAAAGAGAKPVRFRDSRLDQGFLAGSHLDRV